MKHAFIAISTLAAILIRPVPLIAAKFADDLAFLSKHVEVLLLSDPKGGSQVAIAPSYQGRVMTSTASGPSGTSFGWIKISMWAIQDEPFKGDVVNSYNDGPPAPGAKPMGPFYELETSSPAAALKPGATFAHTSRTFHFQGPEPELDRIARKTLGVGLKEIQQAFGGK